MKRLWFTFFLFFSALGFAQQFSIIRSQNFACITDSTGKKLDSLRIPKLIPDIKFAIDSSIVASVHQLPDSASKGFMILFYEIADGRIKELYGFPVSVMDLEEIRQLTIKAGQNSIMIAPNNILGNPYSIPVRRCIRKPEMIRIIKMLAK